MFVCFFNWNMVHVLLEQDNSMLAEVFHKTRCWDIKRIETTCFSAGDSEDGDIFWWPRICDRCSPVTQYTSGIYPLAYPAQYSLHNATLKIWNELQIISLWKRQSQDKTIPIPRQDSPNPKTIPDYFSLEETIPTLIPLGILPWSTKQYLQQWCIFGNLLVTQSRSLCNYAYP